MSHKKRKDNKSQGKSRTPGLIKDETWSVVLRDKHPIFLVADCSDQSLLEDLQNLSITFRRSDWEIPLVLLSIPYPFDLY